ncbi:lactate racemase domain-containing protein [Amycolatopsis acididurans]|uniref:lactate racemase domain-containing protein n=1 Tax=Amycolatopsis acididurans TaxID=2724524 RepID=UPI001FE4A237|nr:lactate racemase domain-containing protein [Amycolatopsis acididurans]
MPDATTISGTPLTDEQVREFLAGQLAELDLDGRSVCLVVPDATRSCPLPMLMGALHAELSGRVSRMTAVVALGTHAAMSEDRLASWIGAHPGLEVRNHEWWNPATFFTAGHISAETIAELSGGLLHEGVDVRINRAVVEHDVTIIVGPVFPHEVVGFSGGNKYLFPGLSGPEVIDVSHWLGALITSRDIIGTSGITAVRALIDEAASLVPGQRHALCVVVGSGTGDLHSASFGSPGGAWRAAAEVSSRVHIRYLDEPVRRVLSIMPAKYEDMWTAAKGFYKVEPVTADGGQVVLYAPHITSISRMHPEIERIGYHTRDYFVRQWDRFKHLHWGVLAHSTHLRGAGTYDAESGEHCRVTVTLATGIPEDRVRAANLDYLDPSEVDPEAWRADPATLVVPDAGEVLFRLRKPVDSRTTS